MKESKESSCTPSAKEKNSLLDEEIGMEFLSSWKTSVTGDNSLDLGFDTVSTGKKNKFNFEKLDMDFDLDGDFDKLSSFKVDMSDLDFSCPLKKAAKPKERSAGESSGGKLEQDQFTFSFNFNELENFDFKTAKVDGERSSSKNLNNKEVIPNKKECDVSKTAFGRSADPFDDGQIGKLQKSTDVSTSKAHSAVDGTLISNSSNVKCLSGSPSSEVFIMPDVDNVETALDGTKTGDFSHENIPSGGANSEGLITLFGEGSGHEKTATNNQEEEEEDHQNHFSEKMTSKSTGPFIQPNMTLPVQLIDGNDLAQDIVSDIQIEIISPTTKVKLSGAQDNLNEELIVDVGFSHDVSQPKELPQSRLARSDRSQKTDSGTTNENVLEHDPDKDCLDDEEISVGSIVQKIPHNDRLSKDTKDSTSENLVRLGRSNQSQKTDSGTTNENFLEHGPQKDCLNHETISAESILQTIPHNNRLTKDAKNSTSKSLVQLGRDTGNDKVQQMKEKEDEIVYPKYFKTSQETKSGADTSSFGSKGVVNLSLNRSEDRKSNSSNVDAEQNDCKMVTIPRPADKGIAKGVSFMLGSERKNKGIKKFGECLGAGAEQNSRTPRLLNKEPTKESFTKLGSTKDIKDIKNIGMGSSVGRKIGIPEELKDGKNKPNVRSLISRTISANKDLSSATLKSKINSLGNMKRNIEIKGKTMPAIVPLTASTKRKMPEMLSTKRKTPEGSNPDEGLLSPRKRLSQLPSESRDRKNLVNNVEEQVSSDDNQIESKMKNILCDHPTSGFERPNEMNTKDLMVPLDVGYDGNVEKAEAYARELEAICNMLRKKNEEAKEIMVQAIVNNNRLLMLNHPIFDEKIRRVQKFAGQLISD